MSIKELSFHNKESFQELKFKDKSVSIELTMVLDNGTGASPFVQMFCIDDFREMSFKEIESQIMDNSAHIARTFALALLNRPDCLNGRRGKS